MKGWGVLLGLLQVLVLLLLEEHWGYLGLEDPGKEEAKVRDSHTLAIPITNNEPPQCQAATSGEDQCHMVSALKLKRVREQDRCGVCCVAASGRLFGSVAPLWLRP